ncbi:MAG: DUF1311 domain-containing protein [Caulobacter sp.]|nr:DUF1311 domain-containing protein [Caulobacter sp.]
MMRLAVVAVLLAAAPAVLHAAPSKPGARSAEERCLDTPGPNIEILNCLSGLTQAQDARLNRAYKAAMGRQKTPAARTALRAAQRAWITSRDEDCMPYYDQVQYGAQGGIEGEQCVLDRTRERADALERLR